MQDVIQAAIGGENATRTFEGRERYAVNVRYEHDYRGDIAALERVLVPIPSGGQCRSASSRASSSLPGPR